MIITKRLKEIVFQYDTETQTLLIQTSDLDHITLNKVYMFSTAIFIAQIMRRQFIRMSDKARLAKYADSKKSH